MKVVPAADLHIPEMVEIWKEFMDFHSDIDPFFKRREDGHENFVRMVKDWIGSEDSHVLVALEGGRVIGYSVSIVLRHPPVLNTERYGFINDLAVRSIHRRKGAGTALLMEMFRWFRSVNVDRVELQVVPKNRIGCRFWEKHGFRDYIHVLAHPVPDVDG
ncbi:MAG: GNAT family N-acetyltransferase [Deltaproteobacteria bacterium]|uniref:GNAT family N-acetyltransferase n=1 Tax=Candidatus Zymogenus saltonus TaxID=2844893 RepID=A0A9D8KCW6_9DELT|nr:GNAT family N-acetyltransferase [Candidatus Zymogenus saltonus]